VQPPAALQPLGAAAATRVEQDKEAFMVASLARRFTALVRGYGSRHVMRPAAQSPLRSVCEAAGGGAAGEADLDAWLAEAHACGVSAVKTFAAGLEQDGAAVRAALTLPWSNGQAEGQINRLKLLETAKLWPGQLRPAATARSDGGMIHAKLYGRPWKSNARLARRDAILRHGGGPMMKDQSWRALATSWRFSGIEGNPSRNGSHKRTPTSALQQLGHRRIPSRTAADRRWGKSGQLRPYVRPVARRLPLAITGVRLRVRHQSAGRARGTTLRSVLPELL